MDSKKTSKKQNGSFDEAGWSFSVDYRKGREAVLQEDLEKREEKEAAAAEEMDKELDDFLPEGETLPEEEFLTKWSGLEEADELQAETTAEEAEEAPAEEKPRELHSLREVRPRGTRWYGLLVGSLVLLFALTGVGFLAWNIGSSIYARATDDSHLRAYDAYLSPIVMLDPAPFESWEEADNDFLQNASLWQVVLKDVSQYTQYDDDGRLIIPLGDVVAASTKLFGPDCSFSPNSPAKETFYTYDTGLNAYHVALFSLDSMMIPYTEEAWTENGKTVLRVGYISPTDPWRTGEDPEAEPSPTKRVEYVLAVNPETNESYIEAIR